MMGDDYLREPALFVGELDGDMNLSVPPASGEEYLKRVVIEAQQCNDVAYAKIDESRLKKPVLNVKPLPECEKAPAYVYPSLSWQEQQKNDFSKIRLYIARLREEIAQSKRPRKKLDIELPDIEKPEDWIKMCTSTSESENMYIEPTLTVILSMNQPKIEQVLEYLVEHIEAEKTIDVRLGRWLYALLTALELPLNPDMCSCLRSLARICSTIRSQLDPETAHNAESLNLFICLVARYFRQLDLADQ